MVVPLYVATANFNPRSPHGERHVKAQKKQLSKLFQSTLPARGATCAGAWRVLGVLISIHAPRTGSDERMTSRLSRQQAISIHAPRTGSDSPVPRTCHAPPYFNPRSPHGERPHPLGCAFFVAQNFNPRSPHGERLCQKGRNPNDSTFQSTLPARGATRFKRQTIANESDFNPRSPHGERRTSPSIRTRPKRYFNPRSPHGERQAITHGVLASLRISIHAPRTGSDKFQRGLARSVWEFQSTLPARGATSRTA